MKMNPMLSNAAVNALCNPAISDADARWIILHIIMMYEENPLFEMPETTNVALGVIWQMIEAEQIEMLELAKKRHEARVNAGKKRTQSVDKKRALLTNASIIQYNTIEDNIIEDNINKIGFKTDIKTDEKNEKPILDFSKEDIFITDDPIGYTMWLCKTKNIVDRRTFAKYLKASTDTFKDVVCTFKSECNQGEHNNAKNLSAILTAKLKKRIKTK